MDEYFPLESAMSSASGWVLSNIGSFLTLNDLHRLSWANKACCESIQRWLQTSPNDLLQEMFHREYNWPRGMRLLVFGISSCYPDGDIGLYRRVDPIMEFSLQDLRFDCKTNRLVGQPWEEFVVSKPPPVPLGSTEPIVCKANDSGSQIFYCGGHQYARESNEKSTWLTIGDTSRYSYREAALFDADTASWKAMPPIRDNDTRGLFGAGCCRLGSKIYIIGGARMWGDRWDSEDLKKVFLFDLETEQWVASGIPDYPGISSTGLQVIAQDPTTLLVVQSVTLRNRNWMCSSSSEIFSLDILSRTWTKLNALPRVSCPAAQRISIGYRGDRDSYQKIYQVLPTGEWEALPIYGDKNYYGDKNWWGTPATLGIGDGASILSLAGCLEIYSCRSKSGRILTSTYNVEMRDANGESVVVRMENHSKMIAVMPPYLKATGREQDT